MATNKKPLDSSNKIKTVPTVCSLRRAVSAEDTGEGDIRRLRESSLGVFERQESEVIVVTADSYTQTALALPCELRCLREQRMRREWRTRRQQFQICANPEMMAVSRCS